ncbi:MAG TPA: alpha/beta fold hydrolase [Candidatus Competibacteraceae bacterium]|nr:alpha/beta fold hydrolase [Candidatus Competibacteraceae bacterium]
MGLLARLAPERALSQAERLFLTPPRHIWPPLERPWLAQARRQALLLQDMSLPEWNGQHLALLRWGEARAGRVVLLHGWGGRATQLHAFIPPLLAAGFEVIGVDAPGHGLSEGRYSSLLQFVHALQQAVAALEGPVEAVIAHSLGAAATAYAISRGLPVARAVLIAPPVDLTAYSRVFAYHLGLPETLRAQLQRRLEQRFGIPWAELDARRAATGNRIPALILHDRQDREVPHAAGAALAAHWPGARLLSTEELGHRRILRHPQVVAEVMAFLRGALPARRTDLALALG